MTSMDNMDDLLLEKFLAIPQHFHRINVSNFSVNSYLGVSYSCYSNASPLSSSSSPPSFSRMASIHLVVDVGIVGALCLFGFIGSTLTIVTLRFDKDKNNTTTWLLQVLAVVDILYLATCVIIQPLNTSNNLGLWQTNNYDLRLIHLHVEFYTWFLASVMQTIMIWVVILVTADRYMAICKPLNCHKLRTIQKCRVAVSGVVVLAVLYNIPNLFEREVVYSRDPCTRSPVATLQQTHLREDKLYFLLYKTLCHLTLRSLGPLLTLIVLNSKLIAALRQLRVRRRSLTRSCNPGDNVTLMLVVVVSVFVVCELPDCCLRLTVTLLEYFQVWDLANDKAVAVANVFVNMLHTFNSSVNFLIYCLVGRKFRRILVQICCGSSTDRSTQEEDVELRITTNQSGGNNALYEMC